MFPNFSELFSKLFDPKTGFFDSKTQTLHSFIWYFWNWHTILVNIRTFSELKFPNFFSNFFAKILQVWKFRFFQKISKLRQPNISKTRKIEKFGKFRLTQGLNSHWRSEIKLSQLFVWCSKHNWESWLMFFIFMKWLFYWFPLLKIVARLCTTVLCFYKKIVYLL